MKSKVYETYTKILFFTILHFLWRFSFSWKFDFDRVYAMFETVSFEFIPCQSCVLHKIIEIIIGGFYSSFDIKVYLFSCAKNHTKWINFYEITSIGVRLLWTYKMGWMQWGLFSLFWNKIRNFKYNNEIQYGVQNGRWISGIWIMKYWPYSYTWSIPLYYVDSKHHFIISHYLQFVNNMIIFIKVWHIIHHIVEFNTYNR